MSLAQGCRHQQGSRAQSSRSHTWHLGLLVPVALLCHVLRLTHVLLRLPILRRHSVLRLHRVLRLLRMLRRVLLLLLPTVRLRGSPCSGKPPRGLMVSIRLRLHRKTA